MHTKRKRDTEAQPTDNVFGTVDFNAINIAAACPVVSRPVVQVRKKKRGKTHPCNHIGCERAAFQCTSDLQRHINFAHLNIFEFVCDHVDGNGVRCECKSETVGNLKKHKLHQHIKQPRVKRLDENKKTICEVCNKAFHTKKELNRHMAVHSTAQPHRCKKCNTSFKHESALKRHMADHDRYDRIRVELDKSFTKNGLGVTAFGFDDLTRDDEITAYATQIMDNIAGFAYTAGVGTGKKWVAENGNISIKDRLSTYTTAAYILTTHTPIEPGDEEKCKETNDFLCSGKRNPIWRIEDEDGDLKRFTRPQSISVQRSYLLATCVSAYDATCLEGELQRYLEVELDMPHGICLHLRAGAGSRIADSRTPAELKRIAAGEDIVHSVVITMIETTSCTFAEIDQDDPDKKPSLTSAIVTSHDGTTNFNIVVRGKNDDFPDTPSVLADKARRKASRDVSTTRRMDRKAATDTKEEM